MLSQSRVLALLLVAAHVAAVYFVGFTALGYERRLSLMAELEPLPPLAAFAFHGHRYTPLFFVLAIPAILCVISAGLSTTQRRDAMAVSGIGLLMLAVWFGVIWLGMGLLIRKLDTVIQ